MTVTIKTAEGDVEAITLASLKRDIEEIKNTLGPIFEVSRLELKRRGLTVEAFMRPEPQPDIDDEEPADPVWPDPTIDEVACPEQAGKPMTRTACKERYGLGICMCSISDPDKLSIRCTAYKEKWADSGAVE